MKLHDYLTDQKITDEAFSQKIGKARSLVQKYRAGVVTPPLAVIARIEKETGGQVSFKDFLPPGDEAA